jgi:glucosamine-phosphate N-acetyltransferase
MNFNEIQICELKHLQPNKYKNVIQLLSQLSETCGDYTNDSFKSLIVYLKENPMHKIWCFLYQSDIVAIATSLIEPKIIHNFGYILHIEDVVVSKDFRGKGLGKRVIRYLIEYGKSLKCYKIILNCTKENVPFYEKCGFTQKQSQMAMYF